MARTTIAPFSPPGGYPTVPLTALAAQATLTAADVANGNQTPHTGREVLFFQNTNAGAQTVTVSSAVDPQNRTADITAYSLPAASFAVLGPFPLVGWKQADGNLYFSASHANILCAVFRMPPIA